MKDSKNGPLNLCKLISKSELGIASTSQVLECRRARNLQLSQYKEMHRWAHTSTSCLDIEKEAFRYMLAGSNDGSVTIYDFDSFGQTPVQICKIIASVNSNSPRAHKGVCSWIQWHPNDSGLFTTSSRDYTLKLWDTNNMKPVEKYTFDNPVYQHSMSSFCQKSTLIAVATASSNIHLVDVMSGTKLQQLKGHVSATVCVQWSLLEENILVSAGQDGQIIVWDVRSSKACLARLSAEGSSDPSLLTNRAHVHAITSLKFTPDGSLLLSMDTEGHLRLWDARTMRRRRSFAPKKLAGNLIVRATGIDVAWHQGSKGQLAFVPDQANIEVVNLENGESISSLIGHFAVANSCAYRSPYQELYTAGFDSAILCWQPKMDQHADFWAENSSKKPRAEILPSSESD